MKRSVVVEVENLANANRYEYSAFRAVALKSAYCSHCQGCQVECPTGALKTHGQVKIGENCISCGMCLSLHGEACLSAKSLRTSMGGLEVKANQKRTLHTYQHFGLRKEWLSDFLRSLQNWVGLNNLGSRQFEAMLMWLKHAELIAGNKRTLEITKLGKKLAQYGVENITTWAVVWVNLAFNSAPVRWYTTEIPWGSTLTKPEMILKIGEMYSQSESTRKNSITALIELLKHTPLGNEVGLGIEINEGKRKSYYKKGWDEPNSCSVLYSLYRYAEKKGKYELTVKEFFEDPDGGPYLLFGISQDKLERILRGLSTRGDGFIRVNIVRDLDNIFLDETVKSVEVLDFVE